MADLERRQPVQEPVVRISQRPPERSPAIVEGFPDRRRGVGHAVFAVARRSQPARSAPDKRPYVDREPNAGRDGGHSAREGALRPLVTYLRLPRESGADSAGRYGSRASGRAETDPTDISGPRAATADRARWHYIQALE